MSVGVVRRSLWVTALLVLGIAPISGPGAVSAFAATSRGTPMPDAVAAAAPQAEWDGSVDLYRKGVFTTQKTWLWCTAAGVQIVRNIVDGETDHRRSSQARYFDWMRERNRYDLPESAGVDPAGWTAGLRHFVDDRYRLVSSRSFDGAVRSAVTSLRRTGLPVALAVARGGHGWILTGFSATADPLVTDDFEVESVRVVGPLYGRQSKGGYDMPPNTSLTLRRLKSFFTPWRYPPKAMVWDGRYVSIQPIGEGKADRAAASPSPAPVTGVATLRRPLAARGPLWLSTTAMGPARLHR